MSFLGTPRIQLASVLLDVGISTLANHPVRKSPLQYIKARAKHQMKTAIKSASTVVDGLDRPFMMNFYPESGGHHAFASKSRVSSPRLFLRRDHICDQPGLQYDGAP